MTAVKEGSLGQLKPAPSVLSAAYIVPAGRRAIVRVIVCNQALQTGVRVSVGPRGAADSPEQYMAYDEIVNQNDTVASVPIALNELDVVRVYSTSGSVSFNISGIERDQ